ncbi:putative heat shock protein [Trypanosoma cruzi]|uniref:Putative heat shock protein n=1 Tax=Trypanosoma cruzi TaxID=5693 RepID=A0A2V2W7K1_TRYCR|nr:putative heat shock protein [Trypanosoma cruzi]
MLQRTCSGSLYAVLEVARDATPQEIKKAYHRLALRLHPDKTGGTTTEQFTLIQEAQSILSDPRQRRVYDTFGRMGIESLRQFGDGMVVMTTAGIRCAFFIIAFLDAAVVAHIGTCNCTIRLQQRLALGSCVRSGVGSTCSIASNWRIVSFFMASPGEKLPLHCWGLCVFLLLLRLRCL